jgi:hypothetical protein
MYRPVLIGTFVKIDKVCGIGKVHAESVCLPGGLCVIQMASEAGGKAQDVASGVKGMIGLAVVSGPGVCSSQGFQVGW